MTSLDAMLILRRFKDRDAGKLPDTPSVSNKFLTVKDAWYIVFKALLRTGGDTELPDDITKAIEIEFNSKEKNIPKN